MRRCSSRCSRGPHLTSQVGQVLLYDRRDDRIDPTSGYYVSLGNDFAGVGFGVDYVRSKVNFGYYYSVAPEWVLSLTGEAGDIFGWNGQQVLLQDRFFVGGDNLRGFQDAGIGPRDSVTDDALGGQKYYVGSVSSGRAARSAQGTRPERARVQRFRHAVSSRADSTQPDAGPVGDHRRDSSRWSSIHRRSGSAPGSASRGSRRSVRSGSISRCRSSKEPFDQTQFFRVSFGTKF